MLCIYHIADHDGKGSAAIVKSIWPEIEFFGFNHDMQVPYDLIEQHDQIVICDIALPIDYLFDLNSRKDLTWIDHHISVIDQYDQKIAEGALPIKGLRRTDKAAIELTWEYYYPNQPAPEGIKLLGANDLYKLEDKRVRPFEYAFQSQGVNRPQDPIWQKLIKNEINIDEMVAKGDAILSWIRVRNYRLVRSLAFETELQGYKCLCANMPQGYSEFFDSVENLDDYDILINFYLSKQKKWNMTLYSVGSKVDVSKIASSYGGGGHKYAAGISGKEQLPEFLASKMK